MRKKKDKLNTFIKGKVTMTQNYNDIFSKVTIF